MIDAEEYEYEDDDFEEDLDSMDELDLENNYYFEEDEDDANNIT